MQPFSLLIKPASADCNLRCAYCFYLDHAALYPETRCHRMSDEVTEKLVSSYLACPIPTHSFAFQGGEPLLMGLNYFKQVATLQRRYATPMTVISNTIQTNATRMTPQLAAFFAKNDYLLGVSVDGPAATHNHFRKNIAGEGSHAAVLRGISLLNAANANYNILTLVSQSNVHEPEKTYRYLRDTLHSNFHQYIECVEFLPDGSLAPYAINAQEWGDFLCRLFDCWYDSGDTRRVSIRLFDTIIARLVLNQCMTCSMAPDCCQYLVVEYNGDVYPCDFFVLPEYRLGNIMTDTWESMLNHPIYRAFGARKGERDPSCDDCPYRVFCQGDCVKNRIGHHVGNATPRSHLCEAWKQFYAHTLPRFHALADIARDALANGQ